jgi:CRM1 C terminal
VHVVVTISCISGSHVEFRVYRSCMHHVTGRTALLEGATALTLALRPQAAVRLPSCRPLLRPVQQVALRLIETFVEKSDDHSALIAEQFVPAMMDPILGDYARNVPDARWVLAAATVICRRRARYVLPAAPGPTS